MWNYVLADLWKGKVRTRRAGIASLVLALKCLWWSASRYLRFHLKGEESDGLVLLFFNNEFFELKGGCTTKPVFFFVNDKLHLAYDENGCGSGRLIFFVYDLSDGSPRIVYANADLST